MPLHLPNQGVVDRATVFTYPLFIRQDVVFRGTLIQILKSQVGGPYGAEPGDPAWFPSRVNPRTAVCQVLSPYAVSQCLRGGGYF